MVPKYSQRKVFRFSEYDADYKYFNAGMYVSSHGNGNLSVPKRFCIPVGNERGIFNLTMARGCGSMGNDPGIFPRRHAYQDFREEKASIYDWRNPAGSIRYLGVLCSGYAEPIDFAGYGNVLEIFGNPPISCECFDDDAFCRIGSDTGELVKKKA